MINVSIDKCHEISPLVQFSSWDTHIGSDQGRRFWGCNPSPFSNKLIKIGKKN